MIILSNSVLYDFKNTKLLGSTFNPIQDGGGGGRRATIFSPVASTNVGIRPQNFLTFSVNSFSTVV